MTDHCISKAVAELKDRAHQSTIQGRVMTGQGSVWRRPERSLGVELHQATAPVWVAITAKLRRQADERNGPPSDHTRLRPGRRVGHQLSTHRGTRTIRGVGSRNPKKIRTVTTITSGEGDRFLFQTRARFHLPQAPSSLRVVAIPTRCRTRGSRREDELGLNFQQRPKIEVTKSCGKLDLKGEMMLWTTSIYKTCHLQQALRLPSEDPTMMKRLPH
ncbi:hypothetical protein BC827DRAFT_1157397 [Russula dissimulans]|nr:hypothetical protein BC827DRAFT_1157397 [Russula dissimulans]